MRLDRVAEDIYIVLSELYAQVTSTVLFTKAGAVVVDALPFPSEAREVISFVESKLGPNSIRYLVLTHHHSDHVYGGYLFDRAEVVAHDLCRESLLRLGQRRLQRAKQDMAELAEVELRLPDITFQRRMSLHLGHRDLELLHTPGHTSDGIGIMIADEKVFVAGDAVMPVPHIVNGDYAQLRTTLTMIKELKPSFIVQGHGDVLLRGEIDEALDSSIVYLNSIANRVLRMVERKEPVQKLKEIDIESCGKSRIPLDGLVSKLHADNLLALYKAFGSTRGEGQPQP